MFLWFCTLSIFLLLSPLLVSTPASWFSVETLMQHHHISLILYLQYFCTSTSPYSYFSVSFSDSVPSVFFANVNVKVFLKVWSWQKLEQISAELSPWDRHFKLNWKRVSTYCGYFDSKCLCRHFYLNFNVRLTSENRFAQACALRGNV